jgi:hypothetical protein
MKRWWGGVLRGKCVCECVCVGGENGRGRWWRDGRAGWMGIIFILSYLGCIDEVDACMGVGKYWCRVYGCMAVCWLARESES